MKKIFLTAIMAFLSVCMYAQHNTSQQATYSIMFNLNSDKVDLNVADNQSQLEQLVDYMNDLYQDSTKVISRIVIDSKASPEGGCTYNKDLAMRRSKSFYDYISSRTYYDEYLYDVKGTGIDWDHLIDMVEESSMDYKGEVLDILRHTPEETWTQLPGNKWKTLVDSRNKQLMDLRGGIPYKYMERNFFEQMRTGSAVNIYFEQEVPKADTVYVEKVDTIYKRKVRVNNVEVPKKKELTFALKTNLLSDLVLIPNIELEIPIGDRFSVNGEFARIWWNKENEKCWQMQNYGVEGRYWFGDRDRLDQLSGFFGGVYFSRSTFDLQFRDKGMQGDVDYSLGLTGGYTLPLSDHFNMEFSLALGYINGEYVKYNVKELGGEYNLFKRGDVEKMSTIFPTKAKVSLVWLINTNKIKY